MEIVLNSLNLFSTTIIGLMVFFLTRKFSRIQTNIALSQLEKDLITHFKSRFNELSLPLNRIVEDELHYFSVNKTTKINIDNESLKEKAIEYFKLCADKAFWYRKGVISEAIWQSWVQQMKFYIEDNESIKNLWKEERKKSTKEITYYLHSNEQHFWDVKNENKNRL